MDKLEILRAALRARDRGAAPAEINRIIRSATGGEFGSVEDLQQALGPVATPGPQGPEAEALSRINQRGGGPVGDFLSMLGHGATLGFSDELAGVGAALIPGGQGYAQARDARRQSIADLRTTSPGASMAAEAAGGMALPIGGGMRAGAALAERTGSRALGAIGGGALSGAAGGGLFAAGEAGGGPTDRLQPAAGGAALGGLLGAATGGAGAVGTRVLEKSPAGRVLAGPSAARAQSNLRRALAEAEVPGGVVVPRTRAVGPDAVVADLGANLGREARAASNQASSLSSPTGPIRALEGRASERGDRIAQELRDAAGLQGTYEGSVEAAEDAVQAVRDRWYKPLEEEFEEVSGPAVQRVLQDPVVAAAGDIPPDRPPSFRELQDLLINLRDDVSDAARRGRPGESQRAREALASVRDAMEADVPGFGQAQAAYSLARSRVDAHELGRSLAFKPPRDITRALQDLPTDEARDAFRQGLLDRFEMYLLERTGGGNQAAKIINAGQNVQQRLRDLSQDEASYQRLLQGLDRESRYSRTWAALSGNSTTAGQQADMFAQVPLSKQEAFRKIVSSLVGMSSAERRDAAELLGMALLTDGEEAARLLAQELSLNAALAAGAGGAVGTTGSRGLFTPPGG